MASWCLSVPLDWEGIIVQPMGMMTGTFPEPPPSTGQRQLEATSLGPGKPKISVSSLCSCRETLQEQPLCLRLSFPVYKMDQ